MATNKHATIRYRTLDRCFSSGRRYYIGDLIEACNKALYDYTGSSEGVKRRQIYDDITFMESEQGWRIPLERVPDGHKKYFRYTDKTFSINNQPINESEALQLKEALLTLSRFKGMPQFEWVDEISARLDSGLGLSQNKNPIIEFEQNKYLRGLEHITPAYNAIINGRSLKINYKSFKQAESEEFLFSPFFLKQYNNRWFLFGMRNGLDNLINLALDRVHNIEESSATYNRNSIIDFSEYFEDIIGVTVENKPIETIQLKVSSKRFPYVQTKPIHGSQKIKEVTQDSVIITLKLIPNNELDAVILSFGEDIEVLSPYSYRNWLFEKVRKTLNQYN